MEKAFRIRSNRLREAKIKELVDLKETLLISIKDYANELEKDKKLEAFRNEVKEELNKREAVILLLI